MVIGVQEGGIWDPPLQCPSPPIVKGFQFLKGPCLTPGALTARRCPAALRQPSIPPPPRQAWPRPRQRLSLLVHLFSSGAWMSRPMGGTGEGSRVPSTSLGV